MVRRDTATATTAALLLLPYSQVRALLSPVALKTSPLFTCNSGRFRHDFSNKNMQATTWGTTCRRQLVGLSPFHGQRGHSLVIRSMYLPPGGGPNRDGNGLGPVLQSVLTFVLVVGFFISPLGGLFFSLLQFSLALSILVPIALIAAFQVWQYFNTISGPCPTCGAPLRVFKDQASICLNCGSIVEADASQTKINLVKSVIDEDDEWQRGGVGSGMGWMDGYFGARPTPPSQTQASKESTFRRERTIIDVKVQEDDE